jgi:ankyrin repeat protein
VNAKDGRGNTPLHLTAQNIKLQAAKFLVSAGADVHAKNNDGKTSLEVAKQLAEVAEEYEYGYKPDFSAIIEYLESVK